ncbi:MAG: type II 3-dehydroquinate dehydratase, partial [Paludibacteraceae bacterium]|nr:type II 3-dehydroquinate dehydratase [Paludibacteraceae bacterium]
MNILIINGPNLNLLGKREPEIYGHRDFDSYLEELRKAFPEHKIDYFQSNHEG